jgi:glutamine amidotransferase
VSVALVDYGAGNLQSVRNALKTAGATDIGVTADPDAVARADRIILPGVGAFAHCMGALSAIDGMIEALHSATGVGGKPFLGICVGMQLMAEAGEEHGVHAGLGWIKGRVRLMAPNDHPLIEPGEAYFLHSFAFKGDQVLATTSHGDAVVAAIGADNRIGVQFHPEKSQQYGIAFLQRFLVWHP